VAVKGLDWTGIRKRLVKEGASVFILGRRQAILDAAVAEIGGDVVALQADVSKQADLDRAYEVVRASKGRIDILVVNAGVQTREPLGAITEEGIDYQLAINFKSVIFKECTEQQKGEMNWQRSFLYMELRMGAGVGSGYAMRFRQPATRCLPLRSPASASALILILQVSISLPIYRTWSTSLNGKNYRM
jgi:NAD(P)-dependent dehydrogenase (short-subunit alcohol dehydrogenase family)